MLLPPPEDPRNQISEKPMPNLPALDAEPQTEDPHLAADAPRGDDLIHYVVQCLEKGSSKAEIRKQLVAFGYSSADAHETVDLVADQHRRLASVVQPGGGGGNTSMWVGGVICLVGIVITVGSFLAAGEGGGRYVIAWGAIIFGGIQFFRGLAQRSN